MAKVYRYRPLAFFAIAFAGAWLCWGAGAYVATIPALKPYAMVFSLLGLILGPTAATLLLVFGSGSVALKADFKARLFDWRKIGGGHAAFAVVMPVAVILASVALSLLFGESADQFRLTTGAGLIVMIPLAMLIAPLLEELGWHGYGVDSLRDRMGMMATTLVFAVLWSVWHAPLAAIPGTYQYALSEMQSPVYLANFFLSVIPASFIANWFYYKNGRSILAALLMHAMLNSPSVLIDASQMAKCIATLIYATVAVTLVIRDWDLFKEGPRNFVK